MAVILPQVREEFDRPRVEFVTLALYAGLITGATIWGCLADIIGRKLSWQLTLSIAVRLRSFKISKRRVQFYFDVGNIWSSCRRLTKLRDLMFTHRLCRIRSGRKVSVLCCFALSYWKANSLV